MSAIFGYLRVSTTDQEVENQRLEIINSGFNVDFWFSDVGISGKTKASDRDEWNKLLEKIRDNETIVVSKIDRLGRDCADILETIAYLSSRNIKLIVLQLGSTDLTSALGKMLVTILGAVAAMERDLLIERTKAGLDRAKSQGKSLGRPRKTTDQQRFKIVEMLNEGVSVSECARRFAISRASVIGIRDHA